MKYLLFLALLLICFASTGQEKKFTFVFLNKKSDAEKLSKEQSDKIMEGHMANINRLASEKKLLVAGPFEGGGGIFILNTTSVDEATAWLSTDPGVQAKRWNIEILPYQPRVGSACLVGEPYEMVKYAFVRFNAIVTKFTAPTYPQIIRKHDEFLKELEATGNVVTEGIFGPNEGGILILRGEVQKEVLESDPGVDAGLIELTFKDLWVAKGAFCEH